MVVLFLVFKGISILFSIVAVSIYSPTNSTKAFPFLHTLSSIYCLQFFDDGHSDWCEVIPHCSSDLHFSNSDVEHLFMYFLAIHMSSLEECLFRPSAHFLNFFFIFSYMSCLHILEINPLSVALFEIFSPILRAVLLFCLWFPLLCKSF